MQTSVACVAVFAFLSVLPVAQAQAQSGRLHPVGDLFVSAHHDDVYSDSQRIAGGLPTVGLALGVSADRAAVRLEWTAPRWHVRESSQRFQFVGPSFKYQQQGHFYQEDFRLARASASVDVLSAHRLTSRGLLRVTWLVGGGFRYRPSEQTTVTYEVLPDDVLTSVNTNHSAHTSSHLAAVAGLDFEVHLAGHLVLVPSVRLSFLPFDLLDDSGDAPRIFMVRPQVGLGWR